MSEKQDTHENIIRACQEYFKWQDRFEHKGSDEAATKARNWLSEIRRLCSLRRVEIQEKRKSRRELRNGKNGRPKNITKGSYQ
jgi:hypothetical protein